MGPYNTETGNHYIYNHARQFHIQEHSGGAICILLTQLYKCQRSIYSMVYKYGGATYFLRAHLE
jgi:hypothetical protein